MIYQTSLPVMFRLSVDEGKGGTRAFLAVIDYGLKVGRLAFLSHF
jgi:hypothetical protein